MSRKDTLLEQIRLESLVKQGLYQLADAWASWLDRQPKVAIPVTGLALVVFFGGCNLGSADLTVKREYGVSYPHGGFLGMHVDHTRQTIYVPAGSWVGAVGGNTAFIVYPDGTKWVPPMRCDLLDRGTVKAVWVREYAVRRHVWSRNLNVLPSR